MVGINQIQVKPQIDLTFANALRSIVRQDPDVIMIGEIRDLETAQIAVQSALTGHLVLSTVHTNDAASTVNRLLDMGVDDYLLTSTVIGILAQRLVRKLCPHCKEPYQALARSGRAARHRAARRQRRRHALPRQGLQPVQQHGLHGALLHPRDAADDRSAAHARDEARQLERAQGRGAARRHGVDVRGRHAQGARRATPRSKKSCASRAKRRRERRDRARSTATAP